MHCRKDSSADLLQQMAHGLAASKQGKSAQVVWTRAMLHQLAAQAHIQEGELCTTLHTFMLLRQGTSQRTDWPQDMNFASSRI